jgi:16S rRNA (uracil1498-N3)-methyltransferase
MQLFFNPDLSENSTEITFSKDESKHIVKVLRKTIGDSLHITNGKGWLFEAKLMSTDIKRCMAVMTSKIQQPKKHYQLHLAVAPTKMNDRFEWFLEKATEIGVDTITPIICDHSERKIIKIDRFEKILQSAMKQSLNCYLPKLNDAIIFKDFVQQKFIGQRYIAHCHETQRKSLKHGLQAKSDVLILVGPEGDFSVKEIEMAIQNKFIPVTLGKTRLRTETAAIVACHSVAFVNE